MIFKDTSCHPQAGDLYTIKAGRRAQLAFGIVPASSLAPGLSVGYGLNSRVFEGHKAGVGLVDQEFSFIGSSSCSVFYPKENQTSDLKV